MTKMKKTFGLFLAGILVLGSMMGCGDVPTSGNAESNGSSSSENAQGGSVSSQSGDTQVINLRTTSFGNNYDVQDMGWRWMMAACYDGIYRNVGDESGDWLVLAGAEKVDISDDGTVYTFHLRKDAKWSDGVPVTAYDYEYGWKRLLDPEYNYSYASFAYNIIGAEEYHNGTGSVDDVKAAALDEYTFEVTLKLADPTFENKLVATPLYPTRQDLAEAAGDAWEKDWTLHVYNGPFCMSELVEDNRMVWTKNPYYWDVDNVHLDTINWYIVAEESTAATMFENGELDVFQPSGDYLIKYREEVEAGNVQSMVTDYPGTVFLTFNFIDGGKSGLVGNTKIRKAISYSINREDIIDGLYGRYKPAYSYVAPGVAFNGKSYRSQAVDPVYEEYLEYTNNPEKLQALFQEGLDELGITTPLSDITITYLCSSGASDENEYIQQIIQQMLGIKVELNVAGDSALLKAQREAGNYDLMNKGWYSDYNDPLDFLYTYYTGAYGVDQYGGYSNTEYDALVDSLTGENDNAKRLEIYQKLENILLDQDCAIVPIYYSTREVFLKNWVKDYKTSSFGASAEMYITYIEGRGK